MARADVSMASGSGFDEALSHFLFDANGGNLLELLRQKCAIGSAINESFNDSDVDAFTMAHSLSYLRSTYIQRDDIDLKLPKHTQRMSCDLYCVFHQQTCKDWQSQEYALDKSIAIFKVLPHRNILTHISDPKTSCLVLLTFVFALENVLFVGLYRVPQSDSLPGPYLGLFHPGSRESFLKALSKMETITRPKTTHDSSKQTIDKGLECDGRLAEISYLASEFDDLFGYLLCDAECYSNYTEPLLLNMYFNRFYGKLVLPFMMRGYRNRHRGLSLVGFLKRMNELLRLVCRVLNQFYNKPARRSSETRSFGNMAVLALIYSYMYGLLSIPVRFTPWNKREPDEQCTCKSHHPVESNFDAFSDADSNISPESSGASNKGPVSGLLPGETRISQTDNMGELGINFASTAADAACVESTRRRDVLLYHAIGMLSEDGNWIKRSERYVDVIDNYKLSLCWYRRPLFSSCFAANFKVIHPWAMMYHQSNVSPCGSTWLEWQGRTVEAWSGMPIWRNRPSKDIKTLKNSQDCILCLKRLVGMRVRDCSSFLLDIDFDLKRNIRKHNAY